MANYQGRHRIFPRNPEKKKLTLTKDFVFHLWNNLEKKAVLKINFKNGERKQKNPLDDCVGCAKIYTE